MRPVDLDDLVAGLRRAPGRGGEGRDQALDPDGVELGGLGMPGVGDGASSSQPSRVARRAPGAAGRIAGVPAFRPPCPSWMPGRAPPSAMARTRRRWPSTCWSSHRPRSWGESRPSGVTAVASTMMVPKPPAERLA